MLRNRTLDVPQRTDRCLADLDRAVRAALAAHAPFAMRLALGIVFLWFGVLKFAPGLSPAADLAGRTIALLTAGHVGPSISVPLLAAWETSIGLGLLVAGPSRIVLAMLLLEMPGTMLPLLLFPAETFTHAPYAPTLEGQYIIKNLVLIAGACGLAATLRGGRVAGESDRSMR